MKKFVKITEIILVGWFLVATCMRLFDIAGGGIFTVLSLLALSIFYLAFGFTIFSTIKSKKEKNEEISEAQNPLFVIAGIVMGCVASIACLGTLFKIMFWPGSGVLLAMGTISFTFFLIGFIVVKVITKNSAPFYNTIILRTGIFFLVISSLYSIPTDTLVDVLYRKRPQYAEMMKESIANPTDEAIRLKMDIYRDSLDNSEYRNR